MSNQTTNTVLHAVADDIDIPDSSYELTEKRYKALTEWFARKESKCSDYNPYLYPQGSFRLGTVVRPVDADGEYDLDMGCRLCRGITKSTHTQRQLKELVGVDIEAYRVAQGFKYEREEKKRCWRLRYADQINFHLDAVPSIPEEEGRRGLIKEAMVKEGTAPRDLAQSVVKHAGAITDNTRDDYDSISEDWFISNSEGYALWFDWRMEQARPLLEKWASAARAAKIVKLPANKRKSPLQRCIQILKRHRDVMFKDDPDGKPISIIITTLAAEAYLGEVELDDALDGILSRMEGLIHPQRPRVPNPVNPAEDFADKWKDDLELEKNFRMWVAQARADFQQLRKSSATGVIDRLLRRSFAVGLTEDALASIPGLMAGASAPKMHEVASSSAKPWSRG
ncbi:MAG: nucleotidyltransferase [bacterium]